MIDNDDMSITYPGRIVTYYPDEQLADIQISAERVFSNIENKDQTITRQLLLGVPVHTPYGGGWSITFPIKPGDTCLLIFSQIGYDHWLYTDRDAGGTIAGQPAPQLKRQFSEDDGFAIVGFNTIPRKINGYSGTHSQWRNSDVSQVISLNDGGSIDITTPNSVTINCETATIKASSKVVLDTPLTEVIGDLVMNNGDFTMNNGTFSGQGVNFNTHIHSQDNDSHGSAEEDTGIPHN